MTLTFYVVRREIDRCFIGREGTETFVTNDILCDPVCHGKESEAQITKALAEARQTKQEFHIFRITWEKI